MQSNLRTVGTWSAVLLLPAILLAAPTPQSTNSAGAGPQSAIGPLACADSLNDQDGAGCLQASSTATSELVEGRRGLVAVEVVTPYEGSAMVGLGALAGGEGVIGRGLVVCAAREASMFFLAAC